MINSWEKWMTAALLCAMPAVLNAQERVQIEGKLQSITEVNYDKVYLAITEPNGNKRLDSARIENGRYKLDVTLEEPVLALMFAAVDRSKMKGPMIVRNDNRLQLYLSGGRVEITHEGAFSSAKVKGSEAHQAYEKLNSLASQYQQEIQTLMRHAQDKSLSESERENLHQQILSKQGDLSERVYGDFVRKHSDSPIYFYALERYIGGMRNDLPKALEMLQSLPAEVRSAPAARALEKRLRGQMEIRIGSMAPDFTQHTPEGEPVSLSSFRGQYVLLDFWASWCGPCRKENPHVVEAYETFKDRNFTVLGVSLDRENDKQRWVQAIKDDKLGAWTNVSDLKYWKNEAALRYGVTGIPQNFLIDPSGKIIARNLRGEALKAKLAEILGE